MLARLSTFVPEISNALRRFPEAALVALACTALGCTIASEVFATDQGMHKWFWDVYLVLIALFPAAFATGLYGERNGTSRAARIGLLAAAAAGIGLLVTFQFAADLARPLLVAFTLLLPALAVHIRQAKDNASFWLFNHDLWLGFGMAAIGSGLVILSLMAIFATLSALFQIEPGPIVYACTHTIAATLAGPLIWLTLAPQNSPSASTVSAAQAGPDGVTIIDTQQTSSRAIALVAKFILVPVLFIYTAIIYAYGLKIAVDGVLPKGQIGWMVLLYGVAGSATLLALYPTRNTGGALVSFFWRYWFLMALPPVALLFLAVFTRTEQYSVTDRRYLVVLAGIWLVLMAERFGVRREEARDLRTILLSLAAFLAFAMAGPWGAIGLTTRQLAADFHAIASSSSAFKDGTFDREQLDEPVRARLVSILKYLGENGRLDLVFPLIANAPAAKHLDIEPAATINARQNQAAKFADFIGLPGFRISPATLEGRTYFSFNAAKASVFASRGFVAGPIVLSGTSTYDTQASAIVNSADGLIAIKLQSKTITVTFGEGPSLTFDAMAIAQALQTTPSNYATKSEPRRFTATNGGISADLVVVAGYGFTASAGLQVSSLTLWLTWNKPPT